MVLHWGGVLSADADLRSDDDDTSPNNKDCVESSRPRFLGIRRFLDRGRHVGVAVPQNEDEGSRCNSASVELVVTDAPKILN